jgi:hypothetical protein
MTPESLRDSDLVFLSDWVVEVEVVEVESVYESIVLAVRILNSHLFKELSIGFFKFLEQSMAERLDHGDST